MKDYLHVAKSNPHFNNSSNIFVPSGFRLNRETRQISQALGLKILKKPNFSSSAIHAVICLIVRFHNNVLIKVVISGKYKNLNKITKI